jgi:tRNA G10  N-methylase Trm11
MKYFFVLGVNPALSLAELRTAIDWQEAQLLAPDLLLVDSSNEINPQALIKKLGGIIKIGVIKKELSDNTKQTELISHVCRVAEIKQLGMVEGKFNFGFSDYGFRQFNKQDLGVKLKRYFKEKNISSRFVISREKNLSSVVVEQNKLLKRGIEIVLLQDKRSIYLGETLAVQPFKDLSRRDYGRPARDDQSGMLPPKLAQAMINLAQVKRPGDLIVDPFCGSGTILSEAILLGSKNIFGLDISGQAIDNTKKNISWIKELYQLTDIKMKFLAKNVVDLNKFVKNNSTAAIITEPYLGPQRGRLEFAQIITELEKLYSQALEQFAQVLEVGGRVVMIWPIFYGDRPINPKLHSSLRAVTVLTDNFATHPMVRDFLSVRGNIVYGRTGQKVFREIIVLEKAL